MKSPQTPLSVTAEPAAELPALPAYATPVLEAASAWVSSAVRFAIAHGHARIPLESEPDLLMEAFVLKLRAALAKPTAPINVAAQEPGAIGAPVASSTSPVAATPNEPTAEGAPALPEPTHWECLGRVYRDKSAANKLAWLASPVAGESLPVLPLYTESEVRAALASVHPVPALWANQADIDWAMQSYLPLPEVACTTERTDLKRVPLYAHPVPSDEELLRRCFAYICEPDGGFTLEVLNDKERFKDHLRGIDREKNEIEASLRSRLGLAHPVAPAPSPTSNLGNPTERSGEAVQRPGRETER